MSRFARLFLPCVALSLFAFGCDDEPTTDGGTMDGGTGGGGMCPAQAPDRDGLMAPCCFRESNEDKLATPGFRLTSMAISKPTSLANPIIAPIIQGALDGETFNWLVQLGGADADGDITLRTGFGIRNADTSFS
ncbi:MAG: hypothetical protein KC416_14070, partial [Myxococcales bacterium]|nr:hypothetical protein [Myxococcales bacterium]